MKLQCSSCQTFMSARDEHAGRTVRCPGCQALLPVPMPAPAVAVLPDQDAPPGSNRRNRKRPVSARLIVTLVGAALLLLVLIVAGLFALRRSALFSPPEPAEPQAGPQFRKRGGGFGGRDRPRNGENPALKEVPAPITLVNGVFEARIEPEVNPGQLQIIKRFQFEARADAVYWAAAREHPRVEMRVDLEPGGLIPVPDHRGSRNETAFHAAQAGTYIVTLDLDNVEGKTCLFTLREMDGSVPLPGHLRIKPARVTLPRLEQLEALDVSRKELTGAAFAPDSKSFWLAHADGTLSSWSQPDAVKRGGFKSAERLYALGVDGRGRLYAQALKEDRPIRQDSDRPVADISVWEDLKPDREAPLPKPSKTLPLAGVVRRMIPAPDGRWLYFLDLHNHKLGRIDSTTAAIERTIDLSPGACSFCLTPDGKTIYACSPMNRIDVIDPDGLTLEKTVQLKRGRPVDIAATSEGVLVLAGDNVGDEEQPGGSHAMLVDLSAGLPEQADVLPLPVPHACAFVALLPDERSVLLSGDRRVSVCSVPAKPGLFRSVSQEALVRDYLLPGRILLSPDGRTLLHDSAAILSVGR